MNPKLQNILEIIQQFEKLDAEQKDNLIKAVKNADRELEITAFKLDRTEKVKKTTAILLEETIEELEQKRKAVEIQNRELEIEAALERIRATAMSMQKSDQLLDVVEILNKELNGLGIPEIRNTHINIFNDVKEKFLNYEYSIYNGRTVYEVGYKSHPSNLQYVNRMREHAENFMITEFTGNDLEEWKKWMKNQGQKLDAALEQTKNLYYYDYSIGLGSIGISTFNPINKEHLEILNKIRNVFNLAYRRYTDITFAEAQAREAQIEAALERVRAHAMGMQSSEELVHVANILREQMGLLGQPGLDTIAVHLYDENSDIFDTWYAIRVGEKGEIKTGKAHFHKNSAQIVREMLNGYHSPETAYTLEASGNKMMEFFSALVKAAPEIENLYKQNNTLNLPEKAYYYLTDFSGGSLVSVSYDPPSEETKNLQKRAASVFDMAYRRYLDLKRVEAQNSIIQADNDRKTSELEDARQLQLAMLPKELPHLPHLEIAVYMKTATEVGGDYYDFSTREDGSFNICLGDATGHGLKAGILVSAMKSIFTTNSPKMTSEEFYLTANNGFKSMHLKRMMMGLTLLNIKDYNCKMINAGMPPVFFYNNKLRSVEQIEEHGIPIGAMKHMQFTALNRKLEKGDVIILMTDGMPELQNETGEMYGYDRTQKYIEQIAENDSREIIEYLKSLSKNWANDHEPEDDITFIVIKVK